MGVPTPQYSSTSEGRVLMYQGSGFVAVPKEIVSVKDFGAKVDGSTDDSTAVDNALASGVALFPSGTTLTNTAPSAANFRWVSFGGEFSGSHPMDEKYPAFGAGALRVASVGNHNAIIGISYNNAAASTAIFPTGVTGYGRMDNAGNQVFGLFGRADMYAAGTATNELNTFNYAGSPSATLPPNRGFGTAEINPITLTIGAAGDYPCSIGIHITPEGSEPQPFRTGIYSSPGAVTDNGVFVDASATESPAYSGRFAASGSGINLLLVTKSAMAANNAVILAQDSTGTPRFIVRQDGRVGFSALITQSTVGVPGAAAVLPSNPVGYLKVEVAGATRVIPYYVA